jgi:hypothetical protein
MIAVCVSAHAENAATLDDTARLLAGLPVTAQLASSTQTGGWQAHAAAMDKYPSTLDELRAVCANPNGDQRLKAAGSHYALSPAAISPDVFIETHDPNERFPGDRRVAGHGAAQGPERGAAREAGAGSHRRG